MHTHSAFLVLLRLPISFNFAEEARSRLQHAMQRRQHRSMRRQRQTFRLHKRRRSPRNQSRPSRLDIPGLPERSRSKASFLPNRRRSRRLQDVRVTVYQRMPSCRLLARRRGVLVRVLLRQSTPQHWLRGLRRLQHALLRQQLRVLRRLQSYQRLSGIR